MSTSLRSRSLASLVTFAATAPWVMSCDEPEEQEAVEAPQVTHDPVGPIAGPAPTADVVVTWQEDDFGTLYREATAEELAWNGWPLGTMLVIDELRAAIEATDDFEALAEGLGPIAIPLALGNGSTWNSAWSAWRPA